VRRRIDIEADDVVQLGGKVRVVRQFELARPVRLQSMLAPMRCTELTLMPLTLAIASAVQCVVSPIGSASVRETTFAFTSASSGGIRDGRVLSRSRPATPSIIKRSCHRQTVVLLASIFDFVPLATTNQNRQ
jgi:hypothetical protein